MWPVDFHIYFTIRLHVRTFLSLHRDFDANPLLAAASSEMQRRNRPAPVAKRRYGAIFFFFTLQPWKIRAVDEIRAPSTARVKNCAEDTKSSGILFCITIYWIWRHSDVIFDQLDQLLRWLPTELDWSSRGGRRCQLPELADQAPKILVPKRLPRTGTVCAAGELAPTSMYFCHSYKNKRQHSISITFVNIGLYIGFCIF